MNDPRSDSRHPQRIGSRQALTPDALEMMDIIARTGSFAAAARELGKVPSALTYSVRQLEESLDVLLFDRSSRQAQLTAAGTELLLEVRRLLQEMDAVANRVRRVASGCEAQLTIAADDIISMPTMFDLVQAFCALRDTRPPLGGGAGNSKDTRPPLGGGAGNSKDTRPPPGGGAGNSHDTRPTPGSGAAEGPPTRLRLRSEVLAGTWEALVAGQADLAIGVAEEQNNPGGIETRLLGEVAFVLCVAPQHPLACASQPLLDEQLVHHRAVAVADTAQRITPITVNLLPGQDVLTVPDMRAKREAQLRGLGCGFLPQPLARPHLQTGRLVQKPTARPATSARMAYAWRAERGGWGRGPRPGLNQGLGLGLAMQWWLAQLESPTTRRALLDRHGGLLC